MDIISTEKIENVILIVREQKVMLDVDLANLYQVETKKLNQQVKRNAERFPIDFMFQLTINEYENLKPRFKQTGNRRGGRRYLPFVFTEHGILMLGNVLNSSIAISTSIQIVRTFINLRTIFNSQSDLKKKLILLEAKYDHSFKVVFDAIRQLSITPDTSKKRIGIKNDD